jgi:hypothetical protein
MFTHQQHRSGSRRLLYGGHELVVQRDPRDRLRRQLTSNTKKRQGLGINTPVFPVTRTVGGETRHSHIFSVLWQVTENLRKATIAEPGSRETFVYGDSG